MKIGFTGTKEGMSQKQKDAFVAILQERCVKEFHHGDCLGADADAHNLVRQHFPDVYIVIHPPTYAYLQAHKEGDYIHEPKPYLDRNKDIVNDTEYLIAAPKENEEVLRSGTWATIRQARRTNKPHSILER